MNAYPVAQGKNSFNIRGWKIALEQAYWSLLDPNNRRPRNETALGTYLCPRRTAIGTISAIVTPPCQYISAFAERSCNHSSIRSDCIADIPTLYSSDSGATIVFLSDFVLSSFLTVVQHRLADSRRQQDRYYEPF